MDNQKETIKHKYEIYDCNSMHLLAEGFLKEKNGKFENGLLLPNFKDAIMLVDGRMMRLQPVTCVKRQNREPGGEHIKTNISAKTLVTGVESEKKGIVYCGQTIICKVTGYNKSKVDKTDRAKVKWAIKVNGEQTVLQNKTGDEIAIEMKENWAGKEITVMPYLNKPTEYVSVKIKVECPITLNFDGKRLLLRVVKENETLSFNYNAVSGRPDKLGKFDYGKERQAMKGIGPIPEGKYYINPKKIQYYRDISWSAKRMALIGRGPFPWGETAWGIGRVWIYRDSGTVDMVGGVFRDNFSIHGGTRPGSGGCIDLTRNDKCFFEKLTKYGDNIEKVPLIVRY
ncbi:MAG: DUF2778 domain-containing protein [Chitinispirillales bacterium]|jgi:hypothetical protein|nr:DUF2778 domain-containing protein [Chitinispirillales bacterium]